MQLNFNSHNFDGIDSIERSKLMTSITSTITSTITVETQTQRAMKLYCASLKKNPQISKRKVLILLRENDIDGIISYNITNNIRWSKK